MLPIISILGYKDSGKTRLISQICAKLIDKGFKILPVKHIPHKDFTINNTDKDTSKLRKCCRYSAYFAESLEFGLIISNFNRDELFETLLKIYNTLQLDLIILEGFSKYVLKNDKIIKIVCVKNIEDIEDFYGEGIHIFCSFNIKSSTILKLPEDINILINFIERFISIFKIFNRLPKLDCGKCGLSCWKMAEKIFRGEARLEDCHNLSNVEIYVDGRSIKLNKFVQNIVRNVMYGILKTLKDVPDVYSEVFVRIKELS